MSSGCTSTIVRAPTPSRSRSNAASIPARSVSVGDRLTDREPVRRRELGERTDPGRGIARSVVRALQTLLREQVEAGEREVDALGRQADDHRGGAGRGARPTPGRIVAGATDDLERVVDPAARKVANGLATTSAVVASTACVAPKLRARSSFSAPRSTATIGSRRRSEPPR